MRRRAGRGTSAPRTGSRSYLAAVIALVLAFTWLGGCQVLGPEERAPSPNTPAPTMNVLPSTSVEMLSGGLVTPRSLDIADDGLMLVTTNDKLFIRQASGQTTEVRHNLPGFASSGALDAALPADFAETRRLYVCYRTELDVRVAPLVVQDNLQRAVAEPALISGIPMPRDDQTGCQIAFGPDGLLYIGTSDGGDPSAPQDLTALGGKILRIDANARQAPLDNPYTDRADPVSKLTFSYGHRDVVGLAWGPSGQPLYAVDAGPGREDEINVIVPGGNYGWNPASNSTAEYRTDGVPMTDLGIVDARPAAWNSGNDPAGLGAALFITGEQWGSLDGDLAVSNDLSQRVIFMQVTGEIVGQPLTLDNLTPIGPTAALAQGPDGNLYALTAAGNGDDRLVRLSVV